MSARRELSALWSRCDTLREHAGLPAAELRPDARRLLDEASDELASALRRLRSASMLTPEQSGELERALAGLAAARCGGLPLTTAVARYAFALQEVAAAFHIALSPRSTDLVAAVTPTLPARNGTAPPATVPIQVVGAEGGRGAASEAVEALAFVTSVAAKGGHRLGGFSGAGSDAGYRFTARCAGCGELVSVLRQDDLWSFTPVVPCARATSPA